MGNLWVYCQDYMFEGEKIQIGDSKCVFVREPVRVCETDMD